MENRVIARRWGWRVLEIRQQSAHFFDQENNK